MIRSYHQGVTTLAVYVFTPSLLVARVGATLSADRFVQWWPLPVFAVVLVVQGCVLGTVLARVLRLERAQSRLLMAALAFKNSQSIPLALVQALALAVPELYGKMDGDSPEDAAARAASYVLFFTGIVSVLRWTVGAALMEARPAPSDPPDDDDGDDDARRGPSVPLTVLPSAAEPSEPRPPPSHDPADTDDADETVDDHGSTTDAAAPLTGSTTADAIKLPARRRIWQTWRRWRPRLAKRA